ncbi:hypothetical protein RB195_000739 [Necator americanus]|uniref:Uncharacterized protein n=1 Tax=Necator americanus TaxID=51031 RepID=A0ABR1DB45_NECAM
MNPNEIRGRADNSSPNALPEVDDDIAPCSSSSNGQVYLRLNVENAVSLPSEFSVLDEAEQLVNLYMNLDRFCESTSVNSPDVTTTEEDALITLMLDSTVRELIEKTCPQCPRFAVVRVAIVPIILSLCHYAM